MPYVILYVDYFFCHNIIIFSLYKAQYYQSTFIYIYIYIYSFIEKEIMY